jgi:hypothetical protein
MVVQLQGRNLTDESATRWCIYARQKVPELIAQHELQRSSDGRGFAYEVNVSNNKLGDCGLYHILKLLYDLNFHIRILYGPGGNRRLRLAVQSVSWALLGPRH